MRRGVMPMAALVGLLVAANLVYFVWSQGAFDASLSTAWRSTGDREPERLRRQVHPELVRVLPPSAASQAAAAAATACLEAGPFDVETELVAAQTALQAVVPVGASEVIRSERPAAWIVYMGRYPAQGPMLRKEEELKRRQVDFEIIDAPATLAPGLALGRYPDREAADAALVDMVRRGVRTARVEQLAPASVSAMLRVAAASQTVAVRLKGLASDPSMAGRTYSACTAPP